MPSSFSLVRGRRMRVTRLDGCGAPIEGVCSTVVTEGFVSVAMTANSEEPEEVTVTNAGGKVCVKDPLPPEFTGFGVEITFCEVDPDLYEIVTGQTVVMSSDTVPVPVGFQVGTDVDLSASGFALELWSTVPGQACTGAGGNFGYILLPFVQGGIIGDFTIENAAVSFVITGANSKDGNSWGVGPYNVVMGGVDGTVPSPLKTAIGPYKHLHVERTTLAPPEATDGCVDLTIP